MITPEQEKWLSHLNNSDATKIYPFDPASGEKFKQIKDKIQHALGDNILVEHRGATSLGISGQGELDIYIPVAEETFDKFVGLVGEIFGRPSSLYPLERARFITDVDGTKAEIFVINDQSQGWINGCKFEAYLKANPDSLNEYKNLKEAGRDLSMQAYYRRKIEFINDILAKTE